MRLERLRLGGVERPERVRREVVAAAAGTAAGGALLVVQMRRRRQESGRARRLADELIRAVRPS